METAVLIDGLSKRYGSTVALRDLDHGLVGWSFLVELIGSIVTTNHWLLDASLIHYMAPAPAADPQWSSALVMIAIGLVAAGAGAIAFDRRDLVSA